MSLLNVIFLAALAGYASTATVDDCPADLPRDQLQVLNDYCYNFVTRTKLDWPSANQECQNLGGSLVLVKSVEVNNFLVKGLLGYGLRTSAWIGLTDLDTEGEFYWEDRTKLDYSNWGANQGGLQDGFVHGEDDCVAIYPTSGKWYDYPCQASLISPSLKAYVCQYKIKAA